MNLLVIDATSSLVAFAVFSSGTRLEEILVGHFDSIGSNPLSMKDACGRELVSAPIPQGLGAEAYLAWVMQWLETRNIRVDVVCHRIATTPDAEGSAIQNVIAYLRQGYSRVPQVACTPPTTGLASLAEEGLRSLALPLCQASAFAAQREICAFRPPARAAR
jgi:hypothetical protein